MKSSRSPFTPIPQDYIRNTLASISTLAELKVAMVLFDRTAGFHRPSVKLKVETLAQLTGLSLNSARDGIARVIERGTFERIARPGRCSEFWLTLETPTKEHKPTPTRTCEGSIYRNDLKDNNLDTLPGQEDSPLQEIAEEAAQELKGKTRRSIRTNEILPTLRDLKAEALTRELEIDMSTIVIDTIREGIEANLRKNCGQSTIWSWNYFKAGLRDALDHAQAEADTLEKIREIEEAKELEEAARETALEEKLGQCRDLWQSFELETRATIEKQVLQGLPDFIRASIKRDRAAGVRGPGVVALEQACLRACENYNHGIRIGT